MLQPHAFPTDRYYDEQRIDQEHGMTLRDWFAGQALINSAPLLRDEIPQNIVELCAKQAYQIADAMLKERSK